MSDKRTEEKERLMREILNKDRTSGTVKTDDVVLVTGKGEDSIDKTAEDVSTMSNMILWRATGVVASDSENAFCWRYTASRNSAFR